MKTRIVLLMIAMVVVASVEGGEEENKGPVLGSTNAKPKVDLSKGFGGNIQWVSYDEALKLNKDSSDNRPVMVLVYYSGCRACKDLKIALDGSNEFTELSKQFLMVNIEQIYDSPQVRNNSDLSPNGIGYVPRIIFYDREGKVRHEIVNENAEEEAKAYPFYYSTAEHLVIGMKKALDVFNKPKKPVIPDVDLSNGFGGNIQWVSYEDAIKLNEDPKDNRPIMVIVYSPRCGWCKILKDGLDKQAEFPELSKKFLMVTVLSTPELKNNTHLSPPKSAYVPRVIFYDRKGKVRHDLVNEFLKDEEKENYPYSYDSAENLVGTMKRVLEVFKSETFQPDKEKRSFPDVDLTNGFGGEVRWRTFEEAMKRNQDEKDNRAVVAIVYSPKCGWSKLLKASFDESKNFAMFTKRFLMASVPISQEVLDNPDLSPLEHSYTPRIIFFDKNGKARHDIKNEQLDPQGQRYPDFFYESADHVVKSMIKSTQEFKDPDEEKPVFPTVDLSESFGPKVEWVSRDEAFRLKKEANDNRPIMAIVYSKGCGWCRLLSDVLDKSDDFVQLSKKFLMVGVQNGKEAREDPELSPKNAGYVPRVLFYDRDGKIRYDMQNIKVIDTASEDYLYSYNTAEDVIETMNRVLELPHTQKGDKTEL